MSLTNCSNCKQPAPVRAPSRPREAGTCDDDCSCTTPPSAAPITAVRGVRPLTLAFLDQCVDDYRTYSFITISTKRHHKEPVGHPPCQPSAPPRLIPVLAATSSRRRATLSP